MEWANLLLSLQGRIRRRDFWVGFSIVMAASLAANAVPLVGPVLSVLVIWPQLAVHAKRLHDMGHSAWWQLAPFAVSMVAGMYAMQHGGEALLQAIASNDQTAFTDALQAGGAGVGAIAAAAVLGLGFELWVGLSPGSSGENKFGRVTRSLLSADPSHQAR
jgi:uncharacterized membrane protein YhaH (DUF805 family)